MPTPTIASISPIAGPIAGGTTITITGTNFGTSTNPYLTAAYIGGNRTGNPNESGSGDSSSTWTSGYPCTDLTIISQTQATCRTAGQDNPKTPTVPEGDTGLAMQTLTAAQCAAVSVGDIFTMKDERDGKVYHIRKMPDEKCWMMDNLAYAGGTSNGGSNYFGDEHALTFADAGGSSPWNSTAANTTTRFVTTNNFTGSDALSSGGQMIQSTTGLLRPTGGGIQCTADTTGESPMDSKCLSYLYNWCSAVGLDGATTPTCAGAYRTTGPGYSSSGVIGRQGGKGGESKGNTNAGNLSGINSPTSGTICPAGWRLPQGSYEDMEQNEWAILNGSMHAGVLSTANRNTGSGFYENWQPDATTGGSETWRSSFGAVSSGDFPGNALGGQSTWAAWWSSSTYISASAAYYMQVHRNIVSSTYENPKSKGVAVRCVMDSDSTTDPTPQPAPTPGTYDFSVDGPGGWYTKTSAYEYQTPADPLQSMTTVQCANMTLGQVATYRDERDGKRYRVKKMPDEKCWMLDNLAYAGGTSNGGSNYFGDEHTLTFANATSSSPWASTTGLTTRYVTTNNYTGSDQNSSGGQMIQNTTGNQQNGTRCTNSATGSNVMTSVCLSYLYNFCSAAGLDSTTTPTCAAATGTGAGTGYVGSTAGSGMGIIGKSGGKGGESKGNTSAGNPSNVNSTTNGTICPAGWRLPQGTDGSTGSLVNTNNEWAILNGSMHNGALSAVDTTSSTATYPNWQPNAITGGNETWRSSFGTVSSGFFRPGGGLNSQSGRAAWWSSSLVGNNISAYVTDLYGTNIAPGTDVQGKSSGFAVRCVMDSAPQYLQEVTMEYAAQLRPGATAATKDARDGKVYRIKKMPDAKIWMMDNLAYAGGTSNGGSSYFGDEHALTFATATNTAGGSAWTSSTGITTRFVTTNNYTGSDQNSSGGQLIQNTTGTLASGSRCTNSATGTGVMTSACLSYLYNWCSAAGLDSTTTPTCADATNTGSGTNYTTTGVIGKAGGKGGESKGNTNAGNPTGVNSTTSGTICPAGWRLPSGRVGSANTAAANANNEWMILMTSLNTGAYNNAAPNTGYTTNYNTNYMGYFQPAGTSIGAGSGTSLGEHAFESVSSGGFAPGSGLYYQSTHAYWWTSSLSSSSGANLSYVLSSDVAPGTDYGTQYNGRTVRCVL